MSDLDNISDLLVCSESEDEKDAYPILMMGDKKRSKSFHDIIQVDETKLLLRKIKKNLKLKNKIDPKSKFDKNEYFHSKLKKSKYYDIKDVKETNGFIDQYRELKIDQDFENQELMEKMPKERYHGNIEYKEILLSDTKLRFNKYCTQMSFRLKEGDGRAQYVIGIDDNGVPIGITTECMEASLRTLFCMAKKNNDLIKVLSIHKGSNGEVAIAEVNRELEKHE